MASSLLERRGSGHCCTANPPNDVANQTSSPSRPLQKSLFSPSKDTKRTRSSADLRLFISSATSNQTINTTEQLYTSQHNTPPTAETLCKSSPFHSQSGSPQPKPRARNASFNLAANNAAKGSAIKMPFIANNTEDYNRRYLVYICMYILLQLMYHH